MVNGQGNERIVITSALPYANGEIHLGHVVSTYLPADIFARFCRLKGREVAFTCATDDFGTPILLSAEKEGKSPDEYVEYWNDRDLKDFTDMGILFDFFHKTSSKENIRLTQYFFRKLYEKDLIYMDDVTQLYCKNDEKFLPDRYVIGTCPYCESKNQYSDGCEVCGRVLTYSEIQDPMCVICNKPPVHKTSVHYFFRLSALSSQLKDWLGKNKNLQSTVRNYVNNWISDGLKDWDITRDMRWGVPVPLEESGGKVLYGWFDNHLCYISSTMLYLDGKGINGKDFWNSSTIYHFIGKDIAYHHYLFLPAMRMAIDGEYKLPDHIPTRGHLMLQGQKFSKSRGWYIGLREFLDVFPADYLRYYFSRITSYDQSDVNFDWDDFAVKINNELVASIGNFIHRTLSFIYTRFDGVIPEAGNLDDDDEKMVERMKSIMSETSELLERNEIDKGINAILEFSAYCNQYFQHKEPWANKDESGTTLHVCANSVITLATLLFPYLPFSIIKLLDQMKLDKDTLKWNYGGAVIKNGHCIGKPTILFRKIEDEEIKERKGLLGRPRSL